jgi:PAS domain S-box-containing protein
VSVIAAAALSLALVLFLFAIAALVERRGAGTGGSPRWRHGAYTLALGVYCTSWTFYGAVGSAVRDGWSYLPIYLGPILLLLLAPRFLRRIARAVAEERATSVSDFIAARFGHDIVVARLVTVIALLGSIPYLALQFRSIGTAISAASGSDVTVPAMVVAAALLALFAIAFGARRFELAGRSEGLVYAIGIDSALKLIALLAVAVGAVVLLADMRVPTLSDGAARLGANFGLGALSIDVGVILLLATAAIIALPRQFYMALVEARGESDLADARWGLAGYLAAMALLVLPIALAGTVLLAPDTPPDLYVLAVPASADTTLLVGFALLGGISAAASMAIVESLALATMVSNDLVFPTLMRRAGDAPSGAIGRRTLWVRRIAIVVIMLLGLAWGLLISGRESLASIGLVAFAAMALFTPHLILGTRAGGRDPLAARVSLSVGLGFWVYTLALPPVLPGEWMAMLAGSWLDPLRLLGIGSASPLVHGVFWSIGANLLAYALVAARGVQRPALPRFPRAARPVGSVRELVELTGRFVGREQAEQAFAGVSGEAAVDRAAAARAREQIAQVVGASSARAVVASALAGGALELSTVARLLDEGGQSLRFSRGLLAATFENIDAGISVVDAQMNVVAWNSRYLELFGYPPGMVRTGMPVAELIRYNAGRGDFGPGAVDYHVAKRLEHMRRGQVHSFERRRRDGRVIKTVGGPMPGGGYVMSFTDMTEEARVRQELRETLDALEDRVEARTCELREANRQLARADRDKTRFLAGASHDLLQPLHAARLFTAALAREPGPPRPELVARIESAIVAAEDLLRALLDISRFDAGGVTPQPGRVELGPFLRDLIETSRPIAEAKGLVVRAGPLPGAVESDAGLLRSVIQNFLTNAIRYTPTGGVLVGTRRRGDLWRIDVVDTGVGIDADQVETIFDEFTRLNAVEAEGAGLGLALVRRIVRLIGGRVEVSSRPGRGSRFSLYLPAAGSGEAEVLPGIARVEPRGRSLRVLAVDNDERIVAATVALLRSLGHRALGARSGASAMALPGPFDAALVDVQLDDGEDGFDVVARLRSRQPNLPILLVTAETGITLRERAQAAGVGVLAKPATVEAIEAFLAAASVTQVEPE